MNKYNLKELEEKLMKKLNNLLKKDRSNWKELIESEKSKTKKIFR